MIDLTLKRIDPAADRINLYTFAPEGGGALPGYDAGAHVDFNLGGVGVRSYSLVDFDPPGEAPAAYRVAVQREDEGLGGSKAMHGLSVGDTVAASPPKNDFRLHEGDAPALLIAGGIGVTPIISFATALADRRTPFRFHYAARTPGACAFRERLEALYGGNLTLWFDDRRMIDLDAVIADAGPETHVYCCGPAGMIEAVRARADEAGIADGRVNFELFSTPAGREDDRPFDVEISDGRTFTVPAGRTIIEVLEENGVDVMYDCARGDCGICRTDVIEGEPDHRDVVLSEAERASGRVMQICVGRAKSPRLTLDI